jgi:hypothetical protein
MAATVYRPLEVVVFNANVIWKRRYELSKQLQGIHIDVALLSEAQLKAYERFFIPNFHFYRSDRFPERKGGTAVPVRRGIPHSHMDIWT